MVKLDELTEIDNLIISNLINNENYYKKVIGFIKANYFEEPFAAIKSSLLRYIKEYKHKYNCLPTKSTINLDISEISLARKIKPDQLQNYLNLVLVKGDYDYKWLVDKTEQWCKSRALDNALSDSIDIAEMAKKSQQSLETTVIPELLKSALSVSFDSTIGHSYNDDYLARFEHRKCKHKKIPYDIDNFNEITQGGLRPKTLTVIVAGTGVGKSLFMCHQATSCLKDGYNVLYVTCEMSEESIADRIDANLLGVGIQSLREESDDSFVLKFQSKIKECNSRMFIKEYPTSQASVNDFEFLLSELEYKKEFKPDIMFVDYLNICTSNRCKDSSVGSYFVVKSIAEELRGLSVKSDIPIITATQSNRGGQAKSTLEITDVAESHGVAATTDFMFALVSTPDLESQNKLLVRQFKNRYSDMNILKQFPIAIDRGKMKVYNCINDYANPKYQSKNEIDFNELKKQLNHK